MSKYEGYKGYPVYTWGDELDVNVIKAEDIGKEMYEAEVEEFKNDPTDFDGEAPEPHGSGVVVVANTNAGIEIYVGEWYTSAEEAIAEEAGYLVTLSEREARQVIEALQSSVSAEASV